MVVRSAGAPDPPKVKCPNCGAPCLYAPSNKWRPFCSERCRSVDLGAWASERYRVAGSPRDAAHDIEEPGDPS